MLASLFKAATFALQNESNKAQQFWQQGLELAQREKIQLDVGKFVSLNMKDIEAIIDSAWAANNGVQVVLSDAEKANDAEGDAAPVLSPAFIEASNLSAREHEVLGFLFHCIRSKPMRVKLTLS